MCENTDLRVVKTKRLIRQALFTLLEEKKIGDIQVSEISAAAEIARQTFYKHYESIDDVLEDYLSQVLERHRCALVKSIENKEIDALTAARLGFEVFGEEAHNFKLIVQNEMDILLFKRLRSHNKIIVELFAENGLLTLPHQKIYPYVLDFLSGGYYTLLLRWLSQDCQPSPETMAAIISEILSSTRHQESYFPEDISPNLSLKSAETETD